MDDAERGATQPAEPGAPDVREGEVGPPGAPPDRRSFRASLQERWDSNPVLVAIGLAFTGATLMLTVVVPIAGWIRDNDLAAANNRLDAARLEHQREAARYEVQIGELQQSLSSIRLSIGPDTDYFDVSGLIVQRETRSEVPQTAASYDGGRFFATATAVGSPWTYDETSELHSTAELLGMTDDDFRTTFSTLLRSTGAAEPDIERVLQGMAELPVHRWRLPGEKLIAGQDVRLNVPTQILVERVAHSYFVDILFGPAQSATDEDTRRKLYARDQSGWILQNQLLTQNLGGQSPLINTLQKRGQIGYAAIETPLFDVTVNGIPYEEYTLHQDWLIISTPSDAYLVRRLVADEGRSVDSALVNQWLEEFRVCENC